MTSGFSRSRRKVNYFSASAFENSCFLLEWENWSLKTKNFIMLTRANQGAIVRDGVAGGAGVKLYVAMRTFQVPPSRTLTDAK
jgi:hypothetical protein